MLARIDRASNIIAGLIKISGVHGSAVHGIFKVTLPLGHNRDVVFVWDIIGYCHRTFPGLLSKVV